jgi:GT2 family glycosyltransferase
VEGGPTSAIIIPTFNGKRGLERCLDSLRWADRLAVDVIVVDSGSTDGTARLAQETPGVRLLTTSSDKWWAGATNVGCSWAVSELGTDVLCLLNHDCTWDEKSYRNLLGAATRRPRDIHCSKVVTATPPLVLFAGGTTSWSGLLQMRGFGWNVNAPLPSCDVVWCGGMGVMIPATLWRSLGGFDEEHFPHYYADSDFCFRARRAGAHVRFCSDSVVTNDRATTGLAIPKQRATLGDFWQLLTSRRSPQNVRDAFRFFARHSGVRAPLALAHLYALHTTMTIVRMARRE